VTAFDYRKDNFVQYLRKNRKLQIKRYKSHVSDIWGERQNARMWALHYSKLIRRAK